MQLNLNRFLHEPDLLAKNHSVFISAPEECAPLVHSLVETTLGRLGTEYLRHSFNADRYFNFQVVQELLQNSSLFGDKNFVEVVFKTKPTAEQQKQLLEFIHLFDEQSFLCLTCDKLDKKELSAPWIQQQHGLFLPLLGDVNESRVWATYLFQSAKLGIDPAGLDLLLNMNQNNLAQLQQEISKLCLLYTAPYEISFADAKENLVDNAQFNVFALSNAYLSGNSALAYKIFVNVCGSIEDSILVLWNFAEDLRKLIRIKGALKNDQNFNNAISGLRIWGESIALFRQANQRISYQQLLIYLDELAQIDCMIKGIKSWAALIKLERLIINFSQGI